MRIQNLRTQSGEHSGGRRVLADVSWEDCDRPARTIYFETSDEFAADLKPSPHAFLTAAIVPAMHQGEKRVLIEGPVCPRLLEGLRCAMSFLKNALYSEDHPIPTVEPIGQHLPAADPGRKPQRSAAFFSGGIDSMALLRRNRLNFALDHPASVSDCIFIHGFDIGGLEREGPRMHIFEGALDHFRDFAQHARVQLIPVYSNIKYLDDDWGFWAYQFFGAALASVAHGLGSRWREVNIASTGRRQLDLEGWGSHPMLDPCYGSADLAIRHQDAGVTRLEKVALLADWPEALDNLRVCLNVKLKKGELNCGQCEKCLRTMIALVAVGVKEMPRSFPAREITPEVVDCVQIRSTSVQEFFVDLVPGLERAGRSDLARAVRRRLEEWDTWRAWTEKRGWKGAIRRWDERYLGGAMTKVVRRIR